jgi:hypothetical protein
MTINVLPLCTIGRINENVYKYVCFNSITATALRTVSVMSSYKQKVTGEQTIKETRTHSYD